jgi:HEAT repeat protein
MVRLDLETLRTALAEGTAAEKQELLEMWHQDMDDWDIFPVRSVLTALGDTDAKVRTLAIKILINRSRYDNLGREELLAIWRMIADPDSEVRSTVIEEIQTTQCGLLYRDDLEKLVPLLRHCDSGIRNSAMHLFLQIPHYFDDELCLEIAEFAGRENHTIQETIIEFLECLGQGSLV